MMTLRLCLALIVVIALPGCDSPSMAFQGVPAQSITIGPSTFSVRVRGDRVESLRISREWRPSESVVLSRAAMAMEQATGCPLRSGSLTGDQAIQRALLACGKRAPPPG